MAISSQESFWRKLQDVLGEQFEVTTDSSEDDGIQGKIFHRSTEMEFRYIPEGTFEMGLSQVEEEFARELCDPPPINLEEMRPVHTVAIKPFIMSCTPVLNNVAKQFFDLEDMSGDFYPTYLARTQISTLLSELGLRLPFEQEWEYACRANTKTLFTFGNSLPEDEELSRWLSLDFSDPRKLLSNSFGLYGMFTGEWCQDEYRVTYAPDSPVEKGSFAIKGGGALFWPWQDEEWVWCVSAMRMPSRDLIDGKCGLRLVLDIPNLD
jgi:formylglycine-generating enzyme required for sulfatase activity